MNPIILSISAVATVLLLGSLFVPVAHAQFQSGGVDKDGTWYAGEGLKHGDFFSYRMCHVDYNECSQFTLQLWIQDDIQVGTEAQWLTKVLVDDGNKRVIGDLHLSKVATEPSGGSEELGPYRGAFKSSIVWLSSFATSDVSSSGGKGPKEFRATSWGKIGNIGGEQVVPQAIETVTVPQGTWEDTVQVGWRTGGYVSKIWVVDDFPFPIRALTYTHVSEGIPPREYEFELLEYKEGVTEDPFAALTSTANEFAASGCDIDPTKDVAIKKSTQNFQYQIHAFYGPEDPVQGCEIYWLIKFLKFSDETEFLNQVQYDFLVVDDDLKPIRSIASEEGRQFLYSPSGQALVTFPVKEDPGTANYVIWVYGLAPTGIVPSEVDDYLQLEIEIFPNENVSAPPPSTSDSPATTTAPPSTSDSSTTTTTPTTATIPDWIKTNAGWWADGVLDDDSFLNGIIYLINNGIIHIPETSQGDTGDTDDDDAAATDSSVPEWVKTNAGWWADGVLDDGSFVSGIQYLIENGIITLGSSSSSSSSSSS